MTYIYVMEFIETKVFTKRVLDILKDGHFGLFQASLIANPESGPVIKGGGGIRKVRWSVEGKGKRGGIRILYQWLPEKNQIFLLFLFQKNEQDNLTPKQLEILRNLMEGEKDG